MTLSAARLAEIQGQVDSLGNEYADNFKVSDIRALLAALREREWVSVSERLPDAPQRYEKRTYNVVVEGAGDCRVMSFQWVSNVCAATEKGRALRWEWNGRIAPWSVTHWMPLPEPPSTPTGSAQESASLVKGGQ